MPDAVDLAAVLARIERPRQPCTVAVLDYHDLRVVTTYGEFTRHSHPGPTRSASCSPAPSPFAWTTAT